MGLSEQYRDMILGLFPKGKAFNREKDTVLWKLCYGLADELARIHGRASVDLINEADPRTSVEMLPDWERALGLPDTCCPANPTTEQRQLFVTQRFTGDGGQSTRYFINLAQALGFGITIAEYREFRCGESQVGQPLTNGDWVWTWKVNSPLAGTLQTFLVGQNKAGDPLRQWGNVSLECALRNRRPGHSYVFFVYS